MKPLLLTMVILFPLLLCQTNAAAQTLRASEKQYAGDFALVRQKGAAQILVAAEDYKVVQIAADALAADVARVTQVKPEVWHTLGDRKDLRFAGQTVNHKTENVVIIGTLDRSPLIAALVQRKQIKVENLRGKWEGFLFAVVNNPLPGIGRALVIVGSDRRGAAYGAFELSQAIGVSPWYWWADVTPQTRADIFVKPSSDKISSPSVKYRGIFLNDEDWGLQPWAANTFDPQKDIATHTYARIFELLLRLKANTLWPAMHPSTRAFNFFPDNKQVADDYAIVMGSSHAEPMLRDNVDEWKDAPERFNYVTNTNGVRDYWETRVKENGAFENIYTLGMRGVHDSAIQGTKNSAERIALLEKIFADQRSMLARHVNLQVEQVPQIFCPYKEVLDDYRSGLRVPDDVTVVFPDDNFGYIRAFATAQERGRKGGFGVYYHISYLGRPLSYLWLETTPPALIWEEMSKAYEHGARAFWMLNVGDIKPAEIGIELFMQMAWDATRWRRDNLNEFLRAWAAREFGAAQANEIAAVMNDYYRLGYARKPEHLQWNLPGEPARWSDFSATDYGDEVQARLNAYNDLLTRAERIYVALSAANKDSFYALVLYPVRGATLANRRYFLMQKAALYAAQGRASAPGIAGQARAADKQITEETAYFNNKLAGGKWRGIMSPEMTPGAWKSMRSAPPAAPENVRQMQIPDAAGLGVAVEGRAEPFSENEAAALPVFDSYTRAAHFIDVFNTGRGAARWTATANQSWIKLNRSAGELDAARIWVSVDWDKMPPKAPATTSEDLTGEIVIEGAGARRAVQVKIMALSSAQPNSKPGAPPTFVESNGVIAIEAENFSAATDRATDGAGWRTIPGLGRTGAGSVAIFPTTAASVEHLTNEWKTAPRLEYKFYMRRAGAAQVILNLIPTQPLRDKQGLRIAVGVDNEPPQILIDKTEVGGKEWAQNVLNATLRLSAKVDFKKGGAHVLKIYMADAGVVLDKITLDFGGARQSYLGAPETRIISQK